jgi:hypothetical protein
MSRTISRSQSSSRRLTDGGKLSRRRKCSGPPGCLETRSTDEFVVLDSECDEVKSPAPGDSGIGFVRANATKTATSTFSALSTRR